MTILRRLGALLLLAAALAACNPAHIFVPAYVASGNSWLTGMANETTTPVKPGIVVLNASAPLSDLADEATALRADNIKVLGYVNVGNGSGGWLSSSPTPTDQIEAWSEADVPLDGLFLDQLPRTCGTSGDADAYISASHTIGSYWNQEVGQGAPWVAVGDATFAGNPGTAIEECWVDGTYGTATVDMFVTFEGAEATYNQIAGSGNGYVGYTGGNVFTAGVGYDAGAEYNDHVFVHLVYDATSGHEDDIIDLAVSRHAANVFVTDDDLPNPWDSEPSMFGAELSYADSLDYPEDP